MSKKLVVIHGATGIGKTAMAIKVAMALDCPIVNADSRQVYKELSIGTAVPTKEELEQVEHFFVHSHSVSEPISAGQYEQEALDLLEKLFKEYDFVVVSGGSGMYINALLYGMDDIGSDDKVRSELACKSLDELAEMLLGLDPAYYNIVDKANRNRVSRAVEASIVASKPYSELRSGEKKKRDFDFIQIALDRPREQLYERINKRVDIMIEQGLEQEAKKALPFSHLSSMQTVGYREFFDYFENKTDLQTAIELIKRNSRRYAKRQYTWLRSVENLHWVKADDLDGILKLVYENR